MAHVTNEWWALNTWVSHSLRCRCATGMPPHSRSKLANVLSHQVGQIVFSRQLPSQGDVLHLYFVMCEQWAYIKFILCVYTVSALYWWILCSYVYWFHERVIISIFDRKLMSASCDFIKYKLILLHLLQRCLL